MAYQCVLGRWESISSSGMPRPNYTSVQNLGGDPPLKFGGPKPLNVVTQSRRTWPILIPGIGHENEYPKLVSRFWGLPQKNLRGVKVYKFRC